MQSVRYTLFGLLGLFLAATIPLVRGEIAGTLGGDFSIDNHGAANYSIALLTPPGRAGIAPALSINYNSSGGNGPLGLGFSISTGFPQAITRGRSILARDGVVRGVEFSSNDKFYLDGKRLICVSGTYGGDNSVYRTEVDSFVVITADADSNGNIITFTMKTKDGKIMTFGKLGSTSDAYHRAPSWVTSSGSLGDGALDSKAYQYALKEVKDTVGNYLTLTYVTSNNGEYQISRIDYTGNISGSVAPIQSIVFAYDINGQRLDQPARYMGGAG
ncbi:MAG: hypothetical protein NVV63_02410 [Opitutus sp.]|nr:hypothetical protein [Opitutus sp.]